MGHPILVCAFCSRIINLPWSMLKHHGLNKCAECYEEDRIAEQLADHLLEGNLSRMQASARDPFTVDNIVSLYPSDAEGSICD